MDNRRILIQFDTDAQASAFDAIAALDSGVEHLLQYAGVNEGNVTGLVHGAIFTRGPDQLSQTAIFVGGSNVGDGERLARKILSTFLGPLRVSVLLDSNGANTTASAAVLCAARHIPLRGSEAIILAGTGPVGSRVARLLLGQGCRVALSSRSQRKAQEVCQAIRSQVATANPEDLVPLGCENPSDLDARLTHANLIVACGAAGVRLLDRERLRQASKLRVAIDLNAVAPAGIEGIDPTDKAREEEGRIFYGAIGTGGLKMKIHRAAVQALFARNDQFLDAPEIFSIGMALEGHRQA